MIPMVVKTSSASCFFLDNGLKSRQGTVQLFWNKIKLEGFTIDFKGDKWLLCSRCLELNKRKRPEVWKNPRGREQWKLHVNYLRAQVNFRQIRAETAGNRYLRSFLPASAGIFTCGTVYLQPSQANLHAPVLQCRTRKSSPDMFNFYVKSVGHDMISDAGRATTRRLKFKGPSLTTKSTKNEGPFENMVFNRKTVWRFRAIKRTKRLFSTFQKNLVEYKNTISINWIWPS